MTDQIAPMGHNKPPVIPPTDADMLADLHRRYPEIATKLAEFESALATYPEKLTLADEETAAALQDLLGQMAKQAKVWAALKKHEKGPWNTIIKVIGNFFEKAEDKVAGDGGLLDVWKPRFQAFLDLKEADNRRKAEEEAEKHRQTAAAAAKAAEEAQERQRTAEREAAAAAEREAEARVAAERAEQEKRDAEERAATAKAEEERIAREKRDREKLERELNAEGLRGVARNMADAENLNTLAEAEEASEDEIKRLDTLIRPGGTISVLAGPVASSHLLTDEQRAQVEAARTRLAELRTAISKRFDARERRRRDKEAKEAEEREAKATAERAARRKADDDAAAEASAKRATAEAEAIAAKNAEKAARSQVREARADQREAATEQKGAAKDAKHSGKEADRAGNRADRLERKVEQSTDADFSRTRGELGTVGSIAGRWQYEVVDRDALLRTLGQLAAYLMEDAVDAAVYRWMRSHQGEFDGERVEGRLPGVVFMWMREARIA